MRSRPPISLSGITGRRVQLDSLHIHPNEHSYREECIYNTDIAAIAEVYGEMGEARGATAVVLDIDIVQRSVQMPAILSDSTPIPIKRPLSLSLLGPTPDEPGEGNQ